MGKVQEVAAGIAAQRHQDLNSVAREIVRMGEDCEGVIGVLLHDELGPCTDLVAYFDAALSGGLDEEERWQLTKAIREDAIEKALKEQWYKDPPYSEQADPSSWPTDKRFNASQTVSPWISRSILMAAAMRDLILVGVSPKVFLKGSA